MMADLDTLATFVKNNFPSDANMPDMQVSVAASSVTCPAGKVMVVLPGNNSELERTICGKHDYTNFSCSNSEIRYKI